MKSEKGPSGEEKFKAEYVDPGVAERAVEAQGKAGKRAIKAREAAKGVPPAETKTVENLTEELDDLFKKNIEGK